MGRKLRVLREVEGFLGSFQFLFEQLNSSARKLEVFVWEVNDLKLTCLMENRSCRLKK